MQVSNRNLLPQGHFDEAVAEIQLAHALDPFSPGIQTALGWIYCYSRQYDRAIA